MKKYTKPMRCPFCKSLLVSGNPERYTNMCEHVFDPNEEHERPIRPTWVCSCEESKGDFWDAQGGFYVSRDGVSHWGEITSALNSFDRDFDNQMARERALRKTSAGRVVLEISRKIRIAYYRTIIFLQGRKPPVL